MDRRYLYCLATLLLLNSCTLKGLPGTDRPRPSKESPTNRGAAQAPTDDSSSQRVLMADIARRQVATPGLNTLGFKVFGALEAQAPAQNLAFSPTSLGRALLMAYAGARGSTREAMATALGMPDQTEKTLGSWAAATGPSLEKRGVAIQVLDSAWIRSDYPVQASFTEDLRSWFLAEVSNFSDSEDGTAKLQAWIKQASKERLDGQGFQLNQDVVLALANVLTFDGRWGKVFEKAQTQLQPFFPTASESLEVPMMQQTGEFMYAEDEGYQVIRLPYEQSVYAMYVLLASDSATASPPLDGDLFDRLASRAVMNQGQLLLPRFSLKLHKPLTEILKGVGLALAFSDSADFSGIADALRLDQVDQEVRVAVDEEGTVAAAATVGTAVPTSVIVYEHPFHMEVNRPFYFAIRDDSTRGVLFMGKVVHPE